MGLFPKHSYNYPYPPGFIPREWQSRGLGKLLKKHGSHHEGQFVFTISAAVASGKTTMAAMIAAALMGGKGSPIKRVIYIAPSDLILDGVCQTFREFGIYLTRWNNKKHASQGEEACCSGYAATYASLASKPAIHVPGK